MHSRMTARHPLTKTVDSRVDRWTKMSGVDSRVDRQMDSRVDSRVDSRAVHPISAAVKRILPVCPDRIIKACAFRIACRRLPSAAACLWSVWWF